MNTSCRIFVECHYASGLAFLEARGKNCGTGSGGFQKGNTCAGGYAAGAAKGAAKGAAAGAAIAAGYGFTEYPPGLLMGSAAGAAAGFVKGIYDTSRKPTRVAKKIDKIGTSEDRINKLVKSLGGSKNSVLDLDGKKGLTLSVKDDDKKTQYTVDISEKEISVYPRCELDCFTEDRVKELANFASNVTSKQVSVKVKAKGGDYTKRVVSRLAKAGFKVASGTAGKFVIATFAIPQAINAVDKALGMSDSQKRKQH